MRKIFFYICVVITIFLVSFYLGFKIKQGNSNIKSEEIKPYIEVKETVAEDEKIGPNARMTLKTYYKKCFHMKKEEQEIPEELVNLNEDELKNRYQDWTVEEFSSNAIVLSKHVDEFCGEHYVLRNVNDYVIVYTINEIGEEKRYLSTDISVLYLPETDQINLKDGIYLYGKDNLIEILQDFE